MQLEILQNNGQVGAFDNDRRCGSCGAAYGRCGQRDKRLPACREITAAVSDMLFACGKDSFGFC